MNGQAFTSTASFYTLFSDSQARFERESALLTDIFTTAPGKRVVDIACGTGLHAQMFAEDGAEVDAFDLSPDMIELARTNRSHPHITYNTGDMRTLNGGPWDMALCLGNSLSLLGDESDLADTFRSVASCLSDGGCFISQILNYERTEADKPQQHIQTAMLNGKKVVAIKNLVPQKHLTYLAMTIFTDDNGEISTLSDTAVLFHITLEQLTHAASAAGLTTKTIYGSYDRSEFNSATSTDLICVFTK